MDDVTGQQPEGLRPEPESSDFQQDLEPLYKQTLELVNEQIPTQLSLWLENNFTVGNLSELPPEVVEATVTTAIEKQQAVIHLSNWEEFDQQLKQKCGETWLQTLEDLVKHASSYSESLKIKLDLYRWTSPEKFEELTKELLQKLVVNVNEPLLLEGVTKICNKITKLYGDANEWMLQNKLGLENQINELVEQYEKEIASCQVTSSGKDSLLNHHSKLKTKYVGQLRTRFEAIGGTPLTKRVLVSYEIQLCGLLNASFDRNARQRKCITEPIQIATDTTDHKDETRQWLSAKRQVSDENDTEASTSTNYKRPMKRSHRDINSILVWMKGEFTDVTKVGDTSICYLRKNVISSGTTAKVYHGFHGDDTLGYREAAVKRFQEKNVHIFKNEMKVWKEVNEISNSSNVNVVSLLAYGEWQGKFYLATELADHDLFKRINQLKQENCKDSNKLVSYVYDISKGLNWLHGRNIIHRDIKPENVLIFSYEQDGNVQEIAKLTDFGISRVVSKDDTGKDTHAAGTDDWSSPEVLEAKNQGIVLHNTKSQDIFSLGLTSFFILTLGRHPFDSVSQDNIIFWNIMDKRVSPQQLADNPIADNLIQQMLNRKMQKRPTVRNILKHPLFWKTGKKLSFFVDFAVAMGENKTPSESLDKDYQKMHAETADTDQPSEFDWLSGLDEEKRRFISKRKSFPKKSYTNEHNRESVSSLVKLIRDKYAHRSDLVDELLKDKHFGKDGQFDEEKYAEYFLNTFPNLLLFLIKSMSGFDEFAKLKEKYFL